VILTRLLQKLLERRGNGVGSGRCCSSCEQRKNRGAQ
jgi:hypothetical protein